MSELELEIVEGIENTLTRIKRLETSLSENIQNFVKAQSKISENSRELTLEIEEIKLLKSSISTTISQAVEIKMNRIIPELLPPIIKGFDDKTKELITTNLEKVKNATGLAQEIIVNANNVMASHKRELTIRRLSLSGIFCLGSILTAGMIFYFFPQHVQHGFSEDSMKTYFAGKVIRKNFTRLSQKDQKLLEEEYQKIYKEKMV